MKTAIVTGGAKGIGAAIVKELAKAKYNVVLNYNTSEEAAKQIKKDFEEQGIKIDIFKADVSKREEVTNMVEYVFLKYGKIDVLVNNAGIDLVKIFTEVTDEDWNYVINTNLYSTFCVSQEVARHMINDKEGVIINISSIFGLIGASCESIYAVSKAGIDGLTKSLAKEFAYSNIRVNSVAPGLINTDMNADLSEEDIKNIEEEIPLRRIGKPEEVAKAVKMLIESDYITGQVVEVNGGWHI